MLLLFSDNAVDCTTDEYEELKEAALIYMLLWPVGVPIFFLVLLMATRGRATPLAHAVRFLYEDYKQDRFYFWEICDLVRKLCLTGFVFLIPQSHTLVRLVLAIFVSLAYVVLLQSASPFHQASTGFVAVWTNVLLLCTLSLSFF